MEKLDFLCMNSQFMSQLGKGDLDCRAQSNTIVGAFTTLVEHGGWNF
jgi:hypothetical protein